MGNKISLTNNYQIFETHPLKSGWVFYFQNNIDEPKDRKVTRRTQMNEIDASLAQNLRALPRAAWILFFGTFLNKFGTFVMPFLALYMTGQGYTTVQAGLSIASYGCGVLCASILGGYLADRFGRRKTIVLSMFSGAAAMLCLSQAHSLATFAIFAAFAGLTGELYRPASSALLADLVPAGGVWAEIGERRTVR